MYSCLKVIGHFHSQSIDQNYLVAKNVKKYSPTKRLKWERNENTWQIVHEEIEDRIN